MLTTGNGITNHVAMHFNLFNDMDKFEELKKLTLEFYVLQETKGEIPTVFDDLADLYTAAYEDLHSFLEECYMDAICANHRNDFPNKFDEWEDEHYEDFYEMFSEEYFQLQNALKADIETMMNRLQLTYIDEVYLAGKGVTVRTIKNPVVHEVW